MNQQEFALRLDDPESFKRDYRLTRSMNFKLFLSEFLGTATLVYLSQTSLTSFELIGTQNDILTRRLATILAYGLAFMLASLMTLNLSGAHLNPAYTLASASFGHIGWRRASNYLLAQYCGSFLGAILLHATFSDKLAQRHQEGLLNGMNSTLRAHGNILSTGKFFSSYPPTEVSLAQLNISNTLATLMLTSLIQIIYKSKLIKIAHSLKPIYLAAAHCLIMATYSANGGPVFNPAQDFSPRLYIYLFGWGSAAFNLYNYKYWWTCAIVAPHFGALIGLALYRVLDHLRTIERPAYSSSLVGQPIPGTAIGQRRARSNRRLDSNEEDSLNLAPQQQQRQVFPHDYQDDYLPCARQLSPPMLTLDSKLMPN